MAAELGRRLGDPGVIDYANDVYWLEREELDAMASDLDAGKPSLEEVTETVE